MKADLEEKFKVAQGTFQDAPENSQGFLKLFSFICMLSFDVYVKTLLIEKMIDGFVLKKNDNERRKTKAQNKKEEADYSGMEE